MIKFVKPNQMPLSATILVATLGLTACQVEKEADDAPKAVDANASERTTSAKNPEQQKEIKRVWVAIREATKSCETSSAGAWKNASLATGKPPHTGKLAEAEQICENSRQVVSELSASNIFPEDLREEIEIALYSCTQFNDYKRANAKAVRQFLEGDQSEWRQSMIKTTSEGIAPAAASCVTEFQDIGKKLSVELPKID
ncbi:hypothetical protein ACR9YC_11915 [Parasphingorhabdus sp. DH2-15]|uniref:hypothetical protein n=1 Tax=Parasphingorhabdus sp. DH2-15 TaxID=3444112 RepID=UPI003F68537A